jgi:hypothetical protein
MLLSIMPYTDQNFGQHETKKVQQTCLVSSDIETSYAYTYISCLVMMENILKEREQLSCASTHTQILKRKISNYINSHYHRPGYNG